MKEFDIEMLIDPSNPWELFLVDVIKKEGMDPWDIDIALLIDKCLKRLEEMRELDFRIPARVIIAVAILLKMKAEHLLEKYKNLELYQDEDLPGFLYSGEESFAAAPEGHDAEVYSVETNNQKNPRRKFSVLLPNLLIRRKRVVKKKATIVELLEALRAAMNVTKRRRKRKIEKIKVKTIKIKRKNFEERLLKIYLEIMKIAKRRNTCRFSELVRKRRSKTEIVDTFMLLLHLIARNKIICKQEKPFGDIEIYVR